MPKIKPENKNEESIIILAGGLGTRLRSVDAKNPKPMVDVLGKPFLWWLINQYKDQGFLDFYISIGYKADVFEMYPWEKEFPTLKLNWIIEDEPLGTGGAVLKVLREFPNLKKMWIINGDTFLPAVLPPIKSQDLATYLVLTQNHVYDAKPNIHILNDRVTKEELGGTYFDAGAIWIDQKAMQGCKLKLPFSIHQALSSAMAKNHVGYLIQECKCYDIGTPDRLERFKLYINDSIHIK